MKFRSSQQIDRLCQEKFFFKKLIESSTNKLITNSDIMKLSPSTSNLNSVCGLNNLGNTCFFNSVLQNLSQTPFLEELLNEVLKASNDFKFLLKHNDDYDSEITDCDEETLEKEKQDQKEHRSMRLKELNLIIREPPGLLTRNFYELITKMTSSSSVQNPTALFSSVCKKVPSFKGFQQQDSHELLRNLLDACKTEEVKRRQSAILETFKINKSNGIDDLLKKKIKRYGRLASHTLIDKIFGGHLLSSIVCEECKTCVQRVEPFLDLSLPIVDDLNNKINPISNFYKFGKKDHKRIDLNQDEQDNQDLVNDPKKNKLSKHQLKKLKRETKKSRKKTGSNSTNEAEQNLENKKKEVDETVEKEDEKEKTENLDKQEDEEEKSQLSNLANSLKDLNLEYQEKSELEKCDTKLEAEINSEQDDEEEEKELGDLENLFKLEAMKSISNLPDTTTETCSIQYCLSKFTSKELLTDKINCEKCTKDFNNRNQNLIKKVYTPALKQYLICELPAVLTIHLKRFQQHGFRLEKSNKYVNFPLVLDMSPFCSKMCVNKSNNKENLYSLYSIVEHSGRLNSGHYTAYVKAGYKDLSSSHFNIQNQQDFLCNQRLCNLNKILNDWKKTKIESNKNQNTLDCTESISNKINPENDKWYYISDSHVNEVSVSKVLKSQAYLLFYERIQ